MTNWTSRKWTCRLRRIIIMPTSETEEPKTLLGHWEHEQRQRIHVIRMWLQIARIVVSIRMVCIMHHISMCCRPFYLFFVVVVGSFGGRIVALLSVFACASGHVKKTFVWCTPDAINWTRTLPTKTRIHNNNKKTLAHISISPRPNARLFSTQPTHFHTDNRHTNTHTCNADINWGHNLKKNTAMQQQSTNNKYYT